MSPAGKKLNSPLLLVLLLGSLLAAILVRVFATSESNDLREAQRRTPVLGTFATYIIITDSANANPILSSMDSLARYLDDELGTFGTGELSDLNRSGYTLVHELSPDLLYLLKKSLFISSITDSLFDPAMGALVNAWGFPLDPQIPDSSELSDALDISGLKNLHISGDTLVLRRGTRLDFGAIAKGYIADRVYSHSRRAGARAALVEIGGEIRCGGDIGRIWRVAVRNPREEGILEMIEIENGAVATSGDYETYFFAGGVRLCHIIDPRTGYPERGTASATVVSEDAATGDALATAICVGGIQTAESIPDSLFDLIIVISEDETGEITEWRKGSI